MTISVPPFLAYNFNKALYTFCLSCALLVFYYRIEVFTFLSQNIDWYHKQVTETRENKMASASGVKKVARQLSTVWNSPRVVELRAIVTRWQKLPYTGTVILVVGTAIVTLIIMALDRTMVLLPNPGLVYLLIVALLAYYWDWRYAAIATLLELFCVYFFFLSPKNALKSLDLEGITQLVTLAAVTGFVLAIVQLARLRRAMAEHAAERLTALNHIGTALVSELDEKRLLHLIAETARDLTKAGFAAFTLRPINELGQPLVPSEGNLFYLAAVVGVTKEQEAQLQRMQLGGEGLLAPIFRHGVPVRVADALAFVHQPENTQAAKLRAMSIESRESARIAAFEYAHGHLAKEGLRSLGVPRGHPIVRSFLGVPLLDRNGDVRGGLLLGHSEPDQFTQDDEMLLVGMASEAAIALENARLFSAAQAQAQELDAIFESIVDGVALVDDRGKVLRENRTAHRLLKAIGNNAEDTDELLRTAASHALRGEEEQGLPVTVVDESKEAREYLVSASPLRQPAPDSGPFPVQEELDISGSNGQGKQNLASDLQGTANGAVVVWHDVTEARRLLIERQAHAETEARRALLQTVIDELPSGVYLVSGRDARLVLVNRAATEVWGATWPYGQPMSDFLKENDIRVFHFDGRPLAQAELATLRAVQGGESVRHHQEIIVHRDGTTLPILVNAVALDPFALGRISSDQTDSSTGTPEPAALVVQQDVTALKEAERLKDEFIGIAAHELRSPLAVVKGFAQMLKVQTMRGKGPELADWQMEAIQDIDQATSRLVELTEDLLDVTRLQGGRLELNFEPTDLVALVQRIVKRVHVITERHRISVNATPEYIIVTVDHRRIEQVVSNLISNAIKYSPDGGDVEITLCEDGQTHAALLSVRDHGIGIPAHQKGRIFSRFMRADNAHAYNIGGTGLGLYLCRELVERNNGRIWFESVEGQGSTFYVSLPLTVIE
jgi:signal transduction histidine kinase/GAF domain-containing protein